MFTASNRIRRRAHAGAGRAVDVVWAVAGGLGVGWGLAAAESRTLAALTLTTVTASVIIHGLSVTPLMEVYRRRQAQKKGAEGVNSSC